MQLNATPGSTALAFVYHHLQWGPKFIERVYRDMEPTFFCDLRQGTNWLSEGKFTICFLCRRIGGVQMQGLPVAGLDPYAASFDGRHASQAIASRL